LRAPVAARESERRRYDADGEAGFGLVETAVRIANGPAAARSLLSRRLSETSIRRDGAGVAVSLLRDAGNPYCDWFFGGAVPARTALARSLGRPSSELAADRVTILLGFAGVAGLYVAAGGAELASCRRADTLAAMLDAGERRAALARRVDEARELFVPVPDDDFHISRIAVAPGLRGRGFGRLLLAECLEAGRSGGFTRFSLDVSAGNASALRLYRAAGFEVEAAGSAAGMRYLRMALLD
jgi:ribosomal protein S18 acetylase RimI-like enzyme